MKNRTATVMLPAALVVAVTATSAGAARTTPLAPECTAEGTKVRCLYTKPSAVPTVFTVPAGVVNMLVAARGGSGGTGDADQSSDCTDGALSLPRAGSVPGAAGGLGGIASAVLNVEPGQVLDLFVGGVGNSANGITGGAGGVNGGAPGGTVRLDPSTDVCDPFNQFGGGGGGGGGGSFVMAHNTLPQVAVPLVSAGGGGGGGTYAGKTGGIGGAGGGKAGDPGAGGPNR
ncbi:glycine-rich protein, partial [Sporichthya sp.]|uniref:glycine-rich protein n=1 Tax=Sporichthya sp. TaxID=65475 RepID=UPI0018526C1D